MHGAPGAAASAAAAAKRVQAAAAATPPRMPPLPRAAPSSPSAQAAAHALRRDVRPAPLGDEQHHSQDFAPALDPGELCYRVLVPTARCGRLIGRGGEVIEKLRAETGARIKVADGVPGCDERLVAAGSSGDDALAAAPAQLALQRIFACVADAPEDGAGPPVVTARLIVPGAHVSSLVGADGGGLARLGTGLGSHIRLESRAGLALAPADATLEIVGPSVDAVSVALEAVGARLRELHASPPAGDALPAGVPSPPPPPRPSPSLLLFAHE